MTPLPPGLRSGAARRVKDDVIVWRLERSIYAPTWQMGEGAFQVGGRWSPPGRRVVYCALDPATAILEVVVHKGFKVLDMVPHKLLQIRIAQPAKAQVLDASTVPNNTWLRPGAVSAGQQAFGDDLLARHPLLVVPSVVSRHSWNLLIDVTGASGLFEMTGSEDFELDGRLHPAAKSR